MNTLEMWMDYVDALADTGRVLLFDYPQQLRTNQALVAGMHAFFAALKGKILLIPCPIRISSLGRCSRTSSG